MKKIILLTFIIQSIYSFAQMNPYTLQLYSLRDSMATSPSKTLAQVQRWGFSTIEGSDTYGLNLDEYKKLLNKYDLNTLAIAVNYEYLDANKHAEYDSIVAVANSLGAKYIVCYWIPHEIGHFNSSDIQKATKLFASAGKKLEANGIQFCFHPHWYEFAEYNGETYLDYLINNTSRSEVQLELDMFWVKHAGHDPVNTMEKYAGRIEIIHIKDRNPELKKQPTEAADPESSTILGTGDISIDKILAKAHEIGIIPIVIEDESSKSYSQIPRSLEYLRSIGY